MLKEKITNPRQDGRKNISLFDFTLLNIHLCSQRWCRFHFRAHQLEPCLWRRWTFWETRPTLPPWPQMEEELPHLLRTLLSAHRLKSKTRSAFFPTSPVWISPASVCFDKPNLISGHNCIAKRDKNIQHHTKVTGREPNNILGISWGAQQRPAGCRNLQELVQLSQPPPRFPAVWGIIPSLLCNHSQTIWDQAFQSAHAETVQCESNQIKCGNVCLHLFCVCRKML